VRFAALALLCVAAPALAGPAGPGPVPARAVGEVVDARAGWRGGRIVTEASVRLADGSRVQVLQPGGAVDGIGMRVFPAPPLLRRGDRVDVELAPGAAGQPRWARRVTTLAAGPGDGTTPLGYVRTTNGTGAPLAWASGCVYITYDAAGTTDIAGDAEFAVMDGVLANWRQVTQSCAYLEFVTEPPAQLETVYDRVNVIKFREDRWCRPAHGKDPEECYSGDAAALTTLFFVEDDGSDRNGEILDADIELNAVNFAISVDGVSLATGCKSDLAATLTHEVGHLMGLDHTCWIGSGDRPVDDQGNPVPLCGPLLSAEVTEATMYNFQDCGETKKASPEADDIAGVCAIYPIADDPGSCARVPAPGNGCCSAGGEPGAGGLLCAALVAVLTVRRRRR